MINTQRNSDDDFDWALYNQLYREELRNISEIHTLVLNEDDYDYQNDQLARNKNILPLHPNHRLLYETILQLNPSSIMELGCGGGDHLHNINTLNPKIELHGRDLSTQQLNFLRERHNTFQTNFRQEDITLPRPVKSPKAELAYTQAVIMHIQTGNGHLVALSNLFNYAQKHVVLMENWLRHNFKDDIEYLFSKGIIPWENIFFYYRDSIELNKPHLMVVSSDGNLNYPRLSHYSILEDGLK